MLTRRRLLARAITGYATSSLGFSICAGAQTVNKTVHIIVGFPAGGSIDSVARVLASQMRFYAPSIVVDNKPGAGGRLALDALKQSDPDGSMIGITPGDQLSLFPHVYKDLSYDPLKDFKPVTTICAVQFLLAVGPMVPEGVETLSDFIAWCRTNPKLATLGTAGAGTRPHFLGEMLARAASVQFTHVPYRGAPPAMQDLLAGRVAANLSVLSNALPLVQARKLRALATTAQQRSAMLPDVPTFREAGYPSLEGFETFGVLLPAKTPDTVADSLASSVHAALETGEVKSGLARLAFDIAPSTRAEFAALIASDSQRWRSAVDASGFKPLD